MTIEQISVLLLWSIVGIFLVTRPWTRKIENTFLIICLVLAFGPAVWAVFLYFTLEVFFKRKTR